MAVEFKCVNPRELLGAFEARIAQAEVKGKITTWERPADGKQHYTHRAADWNRRAWFLPVIEEPDRLVFRIVKPSNMDISVPVYAYYHGHLIETFLSHFDGMFLSAQTSALPALGDIV